jgi:hypothetical protein
MYIIQIIHKHLFFVYHMHDYRRGIKINRVNDIKIVVLKR